MADQDPVEKHDVSAPDLAGTTMVSGGIAMNASSGIDRPRPATRSSGLSVEWADAMDDQLMDEAVLQISGAGHWFLEGWIGDRSVDFLVDSGSAVTALSWSSYQTLVRAGAPVGALQATPRKLRGDNGSSIEILGCSSCVVSFLGLQTEFPILVCDLSADAIIRTDTLGSVLPHTLDIQNGLLFTEGVYHFSCITETPHCQAVFSQWGIAQFPLILRWCYIAPHVRWVAGRCHPAAFWRA